MIKLFAFDCFGTVFSMDGVPREEIADYVSHVRSQDFSPYEFPPRWHELQAHPDSAEGVRRLREKGYQCVTLSNGGVDLLREISEANGIDWDGYIDLVKHGVYKPHQDAYCTVEKDFGIPPEECVMVTANPTFGDVEGAESIGMQARVIRQPGCPKTIIELAEVK